MTYPFCGAASTHRCEPTALRWAEATAITTTTPLLTACAAASGLHRGKLRAASIGCAASQRGHTSRCGVFYSQSRAISKRTGGVIAGCAGLRDSRIWGE